MESVFRFLSRFFREKRGSSTMEYVVILAVGALFAALLFHALQGDEVRSAIQTAVENAILGKTIDAPGKERKIQGINLVGDFADFAIDLACAKGKKKEKCDGTSKFDVQEFEKKIAHLPTAERIAIIKQEAQKIARNNGWERDSKLSRINNREIYYDSKTKKYYALDTRHGRFEVLDKKGKHQGEVDFNLNPTKPADKSRRHDIRVR